ncbi:hypothetical protein DSO57_1005342 [Entomophthora muscae]|uniref:Uncharacterized protein n=1 Tax=Entomophthora muscae TaxID=34485 RepID=A0ACC2RMY1_9FUNG|nr:hypothetical protein DSO57_1005342 [Entomophthora muscae]
MLGNSSRRQSNCIKLGKVHEAYFGCLEIMREGYFWGKANPVSKPVTCPNNATCRVVQDLPYAASWKSTFTFHQMLVMTSSPISPEFLADHTEALSSNVSLYFSGPGKAHMIFMPLLWKVKGRLSYVSNKKGNTSFKDHFITIKVHVVDSQRFLFGRLSLSR